MTIHDWYLADRYYKDTRIYHRDGKEITSQFYRGGSSANWSYLAVIAMREGKDVYYLNGKQVIPR